jgi:hypothetical protein
MSDVLPQPRPFRPAPGSRARTHPSNWIRAWPASVGTSA